MPNPNTFRVLPEAVIPAGARRTLLVLAAGACVGLHAACDSRTETGKAVERSNVDVQSIGGGSGPAGSDEFADTQFRKVSGDLKDMTESGLALENAAAQIILAKSMLGMAQPSAEQAAAQERESLNRATVIRSQIGAWSSFSAQASAGSQFDPTQPISDLKARAEERRGLIEAQEKIKADFDTRLSDLRAKAAEKQAGAKAAEDEYAALKEQASKLTAVMAEPILKQAAERKRASDQLRTDGALLEAQASVLAPQAAEAQLQVDLYRNQVKGYQTAIAQLEARTSESQQVAAQASSSAQRVAADIDKLVQEIRAQRGQPLTEPYDKAQQQLQAAASTAGKAATADGGAGSRLAQGVAQQAIGDLAWSRARGLLAYSILLDSLATAEPALPNREEYAKESAAAAASAKEFHDAARDAYLAAQTAYTGVRVAGSSKEARDAKERLESLAALLGALAQVVDGKAADLGAAAALAKKDEAPAEGEPAPAAAAEASGTPPELTAAIEAVLTASQGSDSAALKAHLILPADAAVADGLWAMQMASDKLNKACTEKFGKTFTEIAAAASAMMGPAGGALGGPDFAALAKASPSDAKVTLRGDQEAEVSFTDVAQPLTFRLVDGVWKLDPQLDKLPAEQLAQLSAISGPVSKAMEETAADIEAGKFETEQAVMVGFMQRIQAAMMGAQGGGGGG